MKLRVLAISLVSMAVLFACTITTHYEDEGTLLSPVTISFGIPHQGTISEYGESYYQFAVGGGLYTIALTNTHSDLGWELYDDSDTFIDECDNVWFAAGDEINAVPIALAAGTYYLVVTEYLGRDGTFTLTVY